MLRPTGQQQICCRILAFLHFRQPFTFLRPRWKMERFVGPSDHLNSPHFTNFTVAELSMLPPLIKQEANKPTKMRVDCTFLLGSLQRIVIDYVGLLV